MECNYGIVAEYDSHGTRSIYAATRTVPFGSFALVIDTCANPASKISAWLRSTRRYAALKPPCHIAPPIPGRGQPEEAPGVVARLHMVLFGSLAYQLYSRTVAKLGRRRRRQRVTVGLVAKLPGIMLPRPDARNDKPRRG